MKIYDLLDMEVLEHALIPGGYVRKQHHPRPEHELPYRAVDESVA